MYIVIGIDPRTGLAEIETPPSRTRAKRCAKLMKSDGLHSVRMEPAFSLPRTREHAEQNEIAQNPVDSHSRHM